MDHNFIPTASVAPLPSGKVSPLILFLSEIRISAWVCAQRCVNTASVIVSLVEKRKDSMAELENLMIQKDFGTKVVINRNW